MVRWSAKFKLCVCTALVAGGMAFGSTTATASGGPIVGQVLMGQPSTDGHSLLEILPQSNGVIPGSEGIYAHTHVHLLVPPDGGGVPVSKADALHNLTVRPAVTPKVTYVVNTPSSIACVYQLVPQPVNQPAGCNPATTTANPSGGAGAIAIVDAYDYPTAAADLATFSSHFGLPAAPFQVVYAGGNSPYITGSKPSSGVSNGWSIEEALDIEWAHAMAPKAKIFLVEAQNSSFGALLTAVLAAQYLVSHNGGGEVSMSWGSGEFSSETSYDVYFSPSVAPSNVTFLASAGDTGSIVSYPAVSPYVIGVGGTTIDRDSTSKFTGEETWTSGGGGVSLYEPRPSFQSATTIQNIVKTHRGTPDVALDANPSSGVSVYAAGTWYIVGGTSASAPAWAGILNAAHAGGTYPSVATEFSNIYSNGSKPADFRDITSSNCGKGTAAAGYDVCTGWGSALTYSGK